MDIKEQLEQLETELSNALTPEELSQTEFKIKKLKMQQELMNMKASVSEGDDEISIGIDAESETESSINQSVSVSDLVRQYGLNDRSKILSEIRGYTGLSLQEANQVLEMYVEKDVDSDLMISPTSVNSGDKAGRQIGYGNYSVMSGEETKSSYDHLQSLESWDRMIDEKTKPPKNAKVDHKGAGGGWTLGLFALLAIIIVVLVFTLNTYGYLDTTPDYSDEASFEAALNNGENLTGKTVLITVRKLVPKSAFGYNIQTGENLNFCSTSHPKVNEGDTIVVKVTDVESVLGSYVIYYKKMGVFSILLNNVTSFLPGAEG